MPKKYNKIDDTQRQKIINAIFNEKQALTETAHRFGYPISTVYEIARVFDEEGRMEVKKRGGNRPRRLSQEHVQWLFDKLLTHPDATVVSLCQDLNQHFALAPPVSRSVVSRAIHDQAGYTLTLLRQEPADYNSPERIQERMIWTQTFLETNKNLMDAVFVDEAGFNLHIIGRFGRAPRGQRPVRVQPTQRGRNLSLIVAMGREGIIASEVELGDFNTQSFESFLVEKLMAKLTDHRIIIMDNARFHTSQSAKDAIESRGHTCLRLPPYSPHLNAAESVISSVKTYIKSQEIGNRETLTQHINNALQRTTPEMAQGWIREADRNLAKANRREPLGQFYDRHDLASEKENE